MPQSIDSGAEVVEAAFAALSHEDWVGFASLLDPAQVDSFREEELERRRKEAKVLTVDEFRRGQPEMPDAVAEYLLAQVEAYRGASGPESLEHLYGVASLDELAALSPIQMISRFLEATDLRRAYKRRPTDRPHATKLPEELRLSWHTIGFVPEGTDTLHCVYRVLWDNRPPESRVSLHPQVITVRQHAGRWAFDFWDILDLQDVVGTVARAMDQEDEGP